MEVGGQGGLSFRHDAFEIPRDIQARMSRGMLRETKGLKTELAAAASVPGSSLLTRQAGTYGRADLINSQCCHLIAV